MSPTNGPPSSDQYDPATLDTPTLERERQRLLDECLSIDLQLSDPNKLSPRTGQRMEDGEWEAWRYGAIRAKNIKMRQYRAVKGELARRMVRGPD